MRIGPTPLRNNKFQLTNKNGPKKQNKRQANRIISKRSTKEEKTNNRFDHKSTTKTITIFI